MFFILFSVKPPPAADMQPIQGKWPGSSMIFSGSFPVLKEELQIQFLFCSCQMNRRFFFDKTIVVIDVMFKSKTDIVE